MLELPFLLFVPVVPLLGPIHSPVLFFLDLVHDEVLKFLLGQDSIFLEEEIAPPIPFCVHFFHLFSQSLSFSFLLSVISLSLSQLLSCHGWLGNVFHVCIWWTRKYGFLFFNNTRFAGHYGITKRSPLGSFRL